MHLGLLAIVELFDEQASKISPVMLPAEVLISTLARILIADPMSNLIQDPKCLSQNHSFSETPLSPGNSSFQH